MVIRFRLYLLASQRNEEGTIVRESTRDDGFSERAWRNVERLADEYGVEVPDEPITDTDSLPAQQLSLYVQKEYPQQWDALDDALYRAVWREERDVSDGTVLRDVVHRVGLEEEVVGRALSDDELRAQLRSRFEQARQRGVTGVPTFVYEGRARQGSIPPNQLRQLVEGT